MSVTGEKVSLDLMIRECITEAERLEISAAYLKDQPNCDHRPAEQKAKTFWAAARTLDLVQTYDMEFAGLIRQMARERKK